jgi:hypothetical protein
MTDEQLQEIAVTDEVLIETSGENGTRRTIIWVVVEGGEVFVRSVLGEKGHWYQRALADPEVSLIVNGEQLRFRAVPANDDDSVARASNGFVAKYRPGRSLDAMVRDEVLATTLRLDLIDR